MFAADLDELKKLIIENPDEMPSSFLRDDSFAAYCYDRLTTLEIKSAFNRDADPDECRKWGISSMEYKEELAMAFAARKASGKE